MNVDPVFVDLFRSDADVQTLADPFAKLAADGALRGAGIEPDVLHNAETEKRFRAMHGVERWQQMAKAHNIGEQRRAAQNEYETERTGIAPDEYQKLEKRLPGERRRAGLRAWLASELALGKSASDLIEHARRYDPEVAGVLAELAGELAAIA